MNVFDKSEPRLDDDARFDRLVDGELSADEYKTLLASLDDEPGGWRRCALAFLEAQAMGDELAAISRGERLSGAPVNKTMPAGRTRSVPMSWTLLPAMAASFLVAFILGVMWPSAWPLARDGNAAAPDLAAVPRAHERSESASLLPRNVGNARLVLSGPGGMQTEAGELPIFELTGDPSNWLTPSEPALPEELVNALERRGHRVEREQQYVPVSLEDGRQGVIPVESYQITPVSRRAY